MKARILLVAIALTATLAPAGSRAAPVSQDRSVEAVILKGAQFPGWSAGPDPTFREPQAPGNPDALGGGIPADPLDQSDCSGSNPWDPADDGDHNCYQSSRIPRNPIEGAPVARLLGFKWNPHATDPETHKKGKLVQIPFQVDERFTRYLSNNASNFGAFSGVDAHNTYAFDREGFRFTDNAEDVCKPIPREEPAGSGLRPATTADPVKGLDDDDELVFMYRDTGVRAPAGAHAKGVGQLFEVAVADPSDPGNVSYAYVGLADERGPRAAFTAENSPYVRYARDTEPNRLGADLFVFSESSYDNYGSAPKGPYCDPATGTPVLNDDGSYKIGQRRPLDTAWVRTPHYSFRYEGRWLMTELHVNTNNRDDWTYGPDLIDRWKARAFQQDPSSDTPCCGYEEEDTNWGGSSILMGERAGPVRVIRETWGADSSTNNARREIFYRDMFVWGDALRVHPIPPLDGIYSQWDYNAGIVTKYYNPQVSGGFDVDGRNDETLGNLDDPCNPDYDGRGTQIDETYRQTYKATGACDFSPYHQSIDVSDPSGGVQALDWEQSSGPYGGMVTRTTIRDHTPGGDAQTLLAVPYYRDDSCFDDGTGTDPGPRRRERSRTEPKTYVGADGIERARKCWEPGDPIDTSFVAIPDEFGDERYFQGDIGTHGVHLLFIAESDNAYQTVPLTEIDSEQRVVVLGPTTANVGERYGRYVEFPLTTAVVPLPPG